MEESDSNSEDDSSHYSKCIDIVVRTAKHSDVDKVFRIYSDSIQYLDVESRDWIEGIVKKKSRRARVYVATSNGDVIGFAIVYKKRNRAYIDALAVDVLYRGRGVGECILRRIEEILLGEGVERIYLTVKNHNNRALGMYIKNGYRISNVIFILEAKQTNIDTHVDRKMVNSVSINIGSVKRSSIPRVKLLDVTMWNNFTWDIDEAIYKVSKEEITRITIARGKRLIGLAQIAVDGKSILVERLALSYYKPSESLKIIIESMKNLIANDPEISIVIPVDSTKTSLLKTLISIGFRIIDSEYVLCKDIIQKNNVLGIVNTTSR
ncbi:GNAT family N-acetyltransferase [Ignisphaera sp. 4213-co]|uniref:GNAT family N-acetyltransferase n=1 Tax=Ignisphaera cupida TaxID=3050454 RepID=A0ABD4Z730_9CREN|nr:GNAT family N-acetyltransferase [Ignisphaera sp. 4213-co]MDK6028120.1 GNAT family N-acetyltransferase [Ignisphaera sp. 4213-co]